MKTAIASIAAASLFSLGVLGTTPAAAYHLTPENSKFKGKGHTSAVKNGISLACRAKFTGTVDKNGVGYVTGGTFTGQVGCSSVTLSNLPWPGTATGKKTVELDNVTFSTPIGDCGPGSITTKLVDGVIKFNAAPLAGGCMVSGKIHTDPVLAIVK
ncbi:MAG TPA: hypothetical protein VGM17_06010 [Rhizomicrobium sp.]|jgi:hypothetical protein